jgi:hypothetical protein
VRHLSSEAYENIGGGRRRRPMREMQSKYSWSFTVCLTKVKEEETYSSDSDTDSSTVVQTAAAITAETIVVARPCLGGIGEHKSREEDGSGESDGHCWK